MRKNDWILLGGLLLVGAALLLWNMTREQAGSQAIVSVSGVEICRLPLSENERFRWQDGAAYVLVETAGGQARVLESSCPDGLCVRQGAVSRVGQMVVCLPNRVTLAIEGEAKDALDAVAK